MPQRHTHGKKLAVSPHSARDIYYNKSHTLASPDFFVNIFSYLRRGRGWAGGGVTSSFLFSRGEKLQVSSLIPFNPLSPFNPLFPLPILSVEFPPLRAGVSQTRMRRKRISLSISELSFSLSPGPEPVVKKGSFKKRTNLAVFTGEQST